MKILFYGPLADAIAREIDIDVGSACTIGSVRNRLAGDHRDAAEALTSTRSHAVAGGSLVTDDHVVSGDEIIEFLPPVSGG